MPKFPEPNPEWVSGVGPDVTLLAGGSQWWRVYFAASAHPAAWNTFRNVGPVTTARFDHHLPPAAVQARSVLYAAELGPICVAEVFQDRRRVSFDAEPRLAAFTLARDVKVLDMTGLWPTRAGASQGIVSGPRARSQRWARTIANLFDVEGILYRSSMHGCDLAIVLWNCPDALPPAPDFDAPLTDPRLTSTLHRCAQSIGYSVSAP
jgi:hypothetical protein